MGRRAVWLSCHCCLLLPWPCSAHCHRAPLGCISLSLLFQAWIRGSSSFSPSSSRPLPALRQLWAFPSSSIPRAPAFPFPPLSFWSPPTPSFPSEMAVADRSAWQRCIPPHAVHPQQSIPWPPHVPITPGAGSRSCTHPWAHSSTQHPPQDAVCPPPALYQPTQRHIQASVSPIFKSPSPETQGSRVPSPEQPHSPPTTASRGGTQRWVTQAGGSHGSLVG